jgi:hypothetical protein
VTGRRFPIHSSDHGLLDSVPWELVAPHEAQARINHGQSLDELASRGGLGLTELAFILMNERWRPTPPKPEHRKKARQDALKYVRLRLDAMGGAS